METIMVNLITNKQQEIQKFLRKYFQDEDYPVEDCTFRWTGIYKSAIQALDIIIVASESEDTFLFEVTVNLPEFNAVINQKNLNDFIKYIYYREYRKS